MRNQLHHHHSCCFSKAARPHETRDHLEEKQQPRPSCLVDQTYKVIWILSLDNCVQFMSCLIKPHLLLLALVDFFLDRHQQILFSPSCNSSHFTTLSTLALTLHTCMS
jgi:hypothetical protein